MMSTSRRADIAHQFICGAEVGVTFEINITNTSSNILHPYADISKLSSVPNEEEFLFFLGAFFRIDLWKRIPINMDY